MQLDMHYYGTYAMARAAGLKQEAAEMIATCAQFVDDNVGKVNVDFKDGARIDAEATAHHTIDFENLDPHDQRRVWVPFHFLPGNQGEEYTERLKCRMDSEIARKMRDHHLGQASEPYGPALVGIAAHVYADTFSHYGFSGVSSRGNKIDNKSFEFDDKLDPDIRDYITKKAARFFKEKKGGGLFANIKSWVAEKASGALGHGAVATYPDRPYLNWSFKYERKDDVEGDHSKRNNPETFLKGCRALHDMFCNFADVRPADREPDARRDFNAIKDDVASVLGVQGPKEKRIEAWQQAAKNGVIFGKEGQSIPLYKGMDWNGNWEKLNNSKTYDAAVNEPIWQFYRAAAMHRTYVLRELLPEHDLIVN